MVMPRFQPDSWRFDVDHPYRFLYRLTDPAPHPPRTTMLLPWLAVGLPNWNWLHRDGAHQEPAAHSWSETLRGVLRTCGRWWRRR